MCNQTAKQGLLVILREVKPGAACGPRGMECSSILPSWLRRLRSGRESPSFPGSPAESRLFPIRFLGSPGTPRMQLLVCLAGRFEARNRRSSRSSRDLPPEGGREGNSGGNLSRAAEVVRGERGTQWEKWGTGRWLLRGLGPGRFLVARPTRASGRGGPGDQHASGQMGSLPSPAEVHLRMAPRCPPCIRVPRPSSRDAGPDARPPLPATGLATTPSTSSSIRFAHPP